MGKIDAMRDPFLSQLIYIVENVILSADKNATELGLKLNDSNVRSSLIKVRKKLHLPVVPPSRNPATKDEVLRELENAIIVQRSLMGSVDGEESDKSKSKEIPLSDWRAALEAVIESIEIRRSPEPGSRYYLDFLHSFLQS